MVLSLKAAVLTQREFIGIRRISTTEVIDGKAVIAMCHLCALPPATELYAADELGDDKAWGRSDGAPKRWGG